MFLEWVNSLVLSFVLSEFFFKLESRPNIRKFYSVCLELRIPLLTLLVANLFLSDLSALLIGDVAFLMRSAIHGAFSAVTRPIHLIGFITGSSALYAILSSLVFDTVCSCIPSSKY